MRFRFTEDHREMFLVRVMCSVLQVSASGYYAWRGRPESARAQANKALVEDIGAWKAVGMTADTTLRLDDHDPLVVAANEAEAGLYRAYRLTPRHRYVAVGAGNLRVRVSEIGQGEPILVVPGNTGDVFPLIPLMAAMQGWRFVAVNRPGGGLSDGLDYGQVDMRRFAVETLDAVMANFGLGQANVMAHSIGAQWCLWLAMDRPGRVRRLVTLGNPGKVMGGRPPLAMRLLSQWPLDRLLVRLVVSGGRDRALRPLRMMGHSNKTLGALPAEFTGCYFRFRRLPHYRVSASSLLSARIPSITAQDLASVTQPISLLWGDKGHVRRRWRSVGRRQSATARPTPHDRGCRPPSLAGTTSFVRPSGLGLPGRLRKAPR